MRRFAPFVLATDLNLDLSRRSVVRFSARVELPSAERESAACGMDQTPGAPARGALEVWRCSALRPVLARPRGHAGRDTIGPLPWTRRGRPSVTLPQPGRASAAQLDRLRPLGDGIITTYATARSGTSAIAATKRWRVMGLPAVCRPLLYTTAAGDDALLARLTTMSSWRPTTAAGHQRGRGLGPPWP